MLKITDNKPKIGSISKSQLRSGSFLHRTCACGQHLSMGECEACKKKRQQQEGMLQRVAVNTSEVGEVPPIVHEVLRSNGQPLDTATRAYMEPRFGQDFSGVRVHTDSRAAESARAVNALAYTVGQDIVFGARQDNSQSSAGKRIMAHELTHTIQQRKGASRLEVNLEVTGPGDIIEQEADHITNNLTNGQFPEVSAFSTQAIARQEINEPPDQQIGEDTTGDQQEAPSNHPTLAKTRTGSSQPLCNPTPLSRTAFLAQAGTGTSEFGLTRLIAIDAIVPEVRISGPNKPVQPTKASLPPISSVYVQAGSFVDSNEEIRLKSGEGNLCPSGKYSVHWIISQEGADKIRQGEQEHCDDFQRAFNISLGRYRDAVNALAISKKRFPTENAAKRYITKIVGATPDDWQDIFICLAQKSLTRDNKKYAWHTPKVHYSVNDRKCLIYAQVGHNSFPEIGQHPSDTIIEGCGEQGPTKSSSKQ